jgi:hypothetical protein
MKDALASYAAAVLSLCLQAIEHGVDLPLSDIECVLCEDGRMVMLMISDGHTGWLSASFHLGAQTDEATFDPAPYRDAFGE